MSGSTPCRTAALTPRRAAQVLKPEQAARARGCSPSVTAADRVPIIRTDASWPSGFRRWPESSRRHRFANVLLDVRRRGQATARSRIAPRPHLWYPEFVGKEPVGIGDHNFGRFAPCDFVSLLSRMKMASTSPRFLRYLVVFRKEKHVPKRSTMPRKPSLVIWRVCKPTVSRFHPPSSKKWWRLHRDSVAGRFGSRSGQRFE